MIAKEVIAKLKVHFPKESGFILLEQVASSMGVAMRYADAIVMNIWKSRFEIIGIEVKVNRSDWLSELKNPGKADQIFQYCDRWFAAAPTGIIDTIELPKGWGHLAIEKEKCFERTSATRNQHKQLDDYFVASIFRPAIEQALPEAEKRDLERKGYLSGLESGRNERKLEYERMQRNFDDVTQRIKDFEEASGINLETRWENGRDKGEALKFVLAGGHLNVRGRLAKLMTDISKALTEFDKKEEK